MIYQKRPLTDTVFACRGIFWMRQRCQNCWFFYLIRSGPVSGGHYLLLVVIRCDNRAKKSYIRLDFFLVLEAVLYHLRSPTQPRVRVTRLHRTKYSFGRFWKANFTILESKRRLTPISQCWSFILWRIA